MPSKIANCEILITAIGSGGDIDPMLLVASEMVKRGHIVKFVASGYFAERVAAANVEFIALGEADRYHEAASRRGLWEPNEAFRTVWQTLLPSILMNYDLLAKLIVPGKTILVGTSLALASRLAQEIFHVPMATVHLSPAVLLSAHAPPMMLHDWFLPKLPFWLRKIGIEAIDTHVLDRMCASDFNEIRTRLGLKHVQHVFGKYLHSPDLVIGAFPDWFAPIQPDWPDRFVLTNFPIRQSFAGEHLSATTEAFLAQGEAPVVFTPGTAMAHAAEFFSVASYVVERLSLRALFLSRYPDQLPNKLPPNVLPVPFEPFNLLFPQVRAVVHHGGIGTCAQALAAGIPQYISPFAHDQFDNATRLKNLGVAEVAKGLHEREWTKGLKALLWNDSVQERCKYYQNAVAEDGNAVGQICDLIESLGG